MGAKLDLSYCGRNVLRVFENRVLRRISWPKRDEVEDTTEDYVMRKCILSFSHQIIVG